jgi:hypothetical protein
VIARLFRAIRLGLAMERLERVARKRGVNVCIHDSWCANAPGFWIVLWRRKGGMGRPVTAWGLEKAIRRANRGIEASAE